MTIKAIRMPKWGLAMEEGTIIEWLKSEGDEIAVGDELIDIETTKITNVLEATSSGVLAKIVATAGEVMPVGALIGVLTEGDVSDAEIAAFIAESPTQIIEEEEADDENAQTVRIIEVNGYRINIAQAGTGRAVVLLHGFSGDHNNWLFTLEDLKGAAHIIAPDLPGHGVSSKDVGTGSLASLAETVAGAIAELGVTGAIVVGHSLGGAVAMRLALDFPALVSRLALICPVGLPGGTLSDDFLTAIVEAEKNRDVKKALQLLVRDPGIINRDMVEGVTRAIRLDGAQAALALLRDRLMSGEDLADLRARLGDLPNTLLISSHHDAIVGSPDVSALPANWDVHWIDDAAHLPHLEAAAQVNALLRDLL